MLIRLFFLAIASIVVLPVASFGDTSISAPDQLSLLKRARPGDVFVLKNGKWKDAHILIRQGGTVTDPVIIKAETPGKVVLSGSSTLQIDAPYVTVEGLNFLGGAIDQGSVIQFNSHHGILRNSAIKDYNPPKFDTSYYWVYFNGDDNLVELCHFEGKNHMGPLIGNGLTDCRRNTVRSCWIKDIPFAKANGREIFRIWGEGKLLRNENDGAYFTVESNLFENSDGEGKEIISLKSNYNRVIKNTILSTRGGITIRRGDHNLVSGNIILGNGKEGAEGIRVTGENNTVQGNFIYSCDYGFRIMSGEYTVADLTGKYVPNIKRNVNVPLYPQVKKLALRDNVVVGVTGADLEMGFGYKKDWPESQMILLPEDCTIQNNRFLRPKGGTSVIGIMPDKTPELKRFKFQPNLFSDNVLFGGRNEYSPSADGFKILQVPAGWSENAEILRIKPLRPVDVGPSWLHEK